MKTILITGATSFIGVHLTKKYLQSDYKIFAVVRPNSSNIARMPRDNRIEILELEQENYEDLPLILNKNEIDTFYHMAWTGTRAPYRDDKILQELNYRCSLKAFDAAVKLGCKTFIGAGSQAEYGLCEGLIAEDYPTNPNTEYGKSKLKTYKELQIKAAENKIRFLWTRIFSVYGVYDYSQALIMFALDKMLKNEDIPLSLCTQNWDYIYVNDVAEILFLLAQNECEQGVYNIANGKSRQLKDFILEMKEICESKSKLKFGEINFTNTGIVSFVPDVQKLKKNLNWSCKYEFKDGIREILEFIKNEGGVI